MKASREHQRTDTRQLAAASTALAKGAQQAAADNPRQLAQRERILATFGEATQRQDRPALQRMPVSIGPVGGAAAGLPQVLQGKLFISSESGRFPYEYGKDFTNDHIGDQAHAVDVLRQRWNDRGLSSPVTVITALDGDHQAAEVGTLSGYDYSIAIDVAGWSAYWNAANRPVTLPITSAVLSGYFLQKGKRGLITHISSSG